MCHCRQHHRTCRRKRRLCRKFEREAYYSTITVTHCWVLWFPETMDMNHTLAESRLGIQRNRTSGSRISGCSIGRTCPERTSSIRYLRTWCTGFGWQYHSGRCSRKLLRFAAQPWLLPICVESYLSSWVVSAWVSPVLSSDPFFQECPAMNQSIWTEIIRRMELAFSITKKKQWHGLKISRVKDEGWIPSRKRKTREQKIPSGALSDDPHHARPDDQQPKLREMGYKEKPSDTMPLLPAGQPMDRLTLPSIAWHYFRLERYPLKPLSWQPKTMPAAWCCHVIPVTCWAAVVRCSRTSALIGPEAVKRHRQELTGMAQMVYPPYQLRAQRHLDATGESHQCRQNLAWSPIGKWPKRIVEPAHRGSNLNLADRDYFRGGSSTSFPKGGYACKSMMRLKLVQGFGSCIAVGHKDSRHWSEIPQYIEYACRPCLAYHLVLFPPCATNRHSEMYIR